MQNKQENERISDTVGGTVVYKADQSLRGRLKARLLGSRRSRLILLSLFSAVILCILVSGALVIIGRLPFKVGSYKVTHGDVSHIASALEKSRGKADDGDKEEAMDRAIMLAALKTEADKQKIPYGHDLIDKNLESMYQQYSGKEGYMKYMQQTHGWSEEDVYTHASYYRIFKDQT
ncbi:MAG: hypothetical protein U0520_01215 [Candidatus Saccharimonadales bacterium]